MESEPSVCSRDIRGVCCGHSRDVTNLFVSYFVAPVSHGGKQHTRMEESNTRRNRCRGNRLIMRGSVTHMSMRLFSERREGVDERTYHQVPLK